MKRIAAIAAAIVAVTVIAGLAATDTTPRTITPGAENRRGDNGLISATAPDGTVHALQPAGSLTRIGRIMPDGTFIPYAVLDGTGESLDFAKDVILVGTRLPIGRNAVLYVNPARCQVVYLHTEPATTERFVIAAENGRWHTPRVSGDIPDFHVYGTNAAERFVSCGE